MWMGNRSYDVALILFYSYKDHIPMVRIRPQMQLQGPGVVWRKEQHQSDDAM